MNCPKCNSEMYDNSADIASGARPRSPLYKCKDKVCGHAIWPPKKGSGGGKTVTPSPIVKPTPKWTWDTLGATYRRSLVQATQAVQELAKTQKLPFTVENVLNAGTTIFIEACRSGVLDQQSLEEKPKQLQEEDAEVTFPY